MVNDCLKCRQNALPTYRKPCQFFDFGMSPAYNAAPSPDESRKTPHGRTFPVQEHHAPQGPAGCPEVEIVLQAGARNHRGGQDGPARSLDDSAAARGDDTPPP